MIDSNSQALRDHERDCERVEAITEEVTRDFYDEAEYIPDYLDEGHKADLLTEMFWEYHRGNPAEVFRLIERYSDVALERALAEALNA